MATPALNTSSGFKATPTNQGVTVQHDIGQLFGHALNALPGYSSLGSNITNPNINYSGAANPPTPSNNYYAPPKVLGANTANGSGSTTFGGSASGGGYASGTGGTTVNPQQSLIDDFSQQKGNIYSSAADAAGNAGVGLSGSILDYINGLTQGQRAIDTKAIGNEQSRLGGIRNVQDVVGQGIKSGGVQLANRNAGTSSASEALARAYGILGRQQLSQVGQQYAQGQQGIANDQQTFNENSVANARKISDSKTQTINQIVADANNSLVNLDSRMAYANLPDRLALDQEKQNIKNQTLQLLSSFDQQLQSAQTAVSPESQDAVQAQAFQLQNAGVAPDSAFSFDTAPAAQFQGTGPFASDLPLFQLARTKRLE